MTTNSNHGELNLEKFYMVLSRYKWLIISLMILSTILMLLNLYFKPSIYLSNSIIEIKSKPKPKMPNDILFSALLFGGSGQVEKEMEILKTFLVNKKAIELLDFNVKYYKTQNYKKIELYNSSPIQLKNISIHNRHIVGKEITLHPHGDYFTLSVKNSLKETYLKFLSPASLIELPERKKYFYDKKIKNEFFEFTIHKNKNLNKEMKFVLCGSSRQIYDNIVQKNLKIEQPNPNAPLIKISYEDNLPQRANDYINALMQSFIDISISTKNEQNNKVLHFINEQLGKIKVTLQASENRLKTFKEHNKIIEPTIQAKKYIEKLSELEIELSENILKKKLISNLLNFSKKNKNLDAIAPSIMQLNDKPTLELITTLQSLQIQKSNLQTELTDQHPKLITIDKQMYHIRNKILYNLKNLKSLILQKSRSLKAEKISYESKIEALPKEEKTIVNINRDYQVSSNMYNYLLKKKTESELLIVSTLSDYKIIDEAYSKSEAIKPKKLLLLIIAPLIGFFTGVILAVILAGSNKHISSHKELENLTELPILGLIPELSNIKTKLEVYNNPYSRFTESFRMLRNNLIAKKPNEEAKTILITSTIADEGKTTITSNLASICQTANYKVIMLNLDLRKPTLHEHFNLQNEKGMSSYLLGKDTIQDIIFATKYTNLHIITSGPIPTNPSELILSNRFFELLEILKSRYDYIFIDTAPVGLVSDSIHLMKLSDQNIIILRENYSEASFISSLNNIIEKNKLQNIGLVLNRTKSKTKSYGYGYEYGYGE